LKHSESWSKVDPSENVTNNQGNPLSKSKAAEMGRLLRGRTFKLGFLM
jgi:hypothetical protein